MMKRVVDFAIAMTVVAVSSASANALIGHWQADGDAADATGNGHDGALVNGTGFGPGLSGQAFVFDGQDDFVSVADDNALDFGPNQDFSIALWVNATPNQASWQGTILAKFDDGNRPNGYSLAVRGVFDGANEGKLQFMLGNGPGTPLLLRSTGAVDDGVWHHVAIRVDRDGLASLFLDGVLNNTLNVASAAARDQSTAADLVLGKENAFVQFPFPFTGALDDTRLYDGLLSDAEIQALAIIDTTPPELQASANPASLWPPNHMYHTIDLTLLATDNVDANVSIFNATVVSSEADDALAPGKGKKSKKGKKGKEKKGKKSKKNRRNGDGHTTGDIRVTKPDGSVIISSNDNPVVHFDPAADVLELRAERAGRNGGRVYAIELTATDAAGNTSDPVVVEVRVERGNAASKPVADRFGMGNYPNPFNPETAISYSLPQTADVRLVIYNALGQHVRELVYAVQSRGQYSVLWDGRDASNQPVSSGVYFYQLAVGTNIATGKMLLTK